MTEQIARLRIPLEDIEPIIWPRVERPLADSLKALRYYAANASSLVSLVVGTNGR